MQKKKVRQYSKKGQAALTMPLAESQMLVMLASFVFALSFVLSVVMIFFPSLRFVSVALIVLGIILMMVGFLKRQRSWALLLALLSLLLLNLAFMVPGAVITFWTSLVLNVAALLLALFALKDGEMKKWHTLTLVVCLLLLLFQIYLAYLIFTGRLVTQ